ncbi:MAG: AAA family ATPase [Acidimicrobiaceae bacterium]|nr:AAA family ATPase [Acidimicrobiaceae bacterium]MXZ52943.1 AAA family ATPase [Acidimicrobiaceae bacterium]MYB88097.1 AAA family ATPase [Acidimicrobiaceae bacterium]MYH92265.1 AAA family ATPase [Acidimicrobiaceae bacterium]
MRLLRSVIPTDEQLKLIGDLKQGFRVIRGAAGSGKTTTALLCLKGLVSARLHRRQRLGHDAPVRVLVLTFNRTLEGYIAELARREIPRDDALDLEISTFARWARSLVGHVVIAQDGQISAMLRPHLQALAGSQPHEFLVDEVQYILGRFQYDPGGFEQESLSAYLTVVREGRGTTPRVTRSDREKLIREVIPAYMEAKQARGEIDWSDLAMLAADADPGLLYDVVIVDETQDFSANQVRAVLDHLDDSHSTTFIVDATQRIYPQFLKWSEVGVNRPTAYRLKENYRNTAAIAAFAHPLVEGLPPEDDGTLPDVSACRSGGETPTVVVGRYPDQLRYMLDCLQHAVDLTSESVALLKPRGGRWFDEVRAELSRRGLPYCELTRENEWPTGSEMIALCTFHSAKGLEFDHVLVPGLSQQLTPHGPESGDADLERLRRMLAMAIGRARKSVMIGYKPGEESSLIGLLNPSSYKLVGV